MGLKEIESAILADLKTVAKRGRRALLSSNVMATEKCSVCGCTEDRACENGCTWAEPGLCSKCAYPKIEDRAFARGRVRR